MKNEIKEIFKRFIESKFNNLNEFISDLISVENEYNEDNKKNKELWFKFSTDDTLSTTIYDLSKDLNPHNINRSFMIENIESSIKNNSLLIFFN